MTINPKPPRVCLLRGDGLGVELLDHARRALITAIPEVELEEVSIGFGSFERTGTALPEESLDAARRAEACLLVAVGSPSAPTPGYRSPIVALRCELDLFANVRPVVSLPNNAVLDTVLDAAPAVDLVIVRENTEGLYAGRERVEEGRAIAERVVSEHASRRIARFAGQLAAERSGRITVVHKANVLRETCGLFRTTALDELALIPGLEVDEFLVDSMALRLATDPESFDVIVTTNLFGDILSDLAAHAGGGLGLVTSANLGEHKALFEPVHGSGPDLVGTGFANPVATLRAVAWLVQHLGRSRSAQQLNGAIEHSLIHGPHTPDLGGTATTDQVVESILEFVNEGELQPASTTQGISS